MIKGLFTENPDFFLFAINVDSQIVKEKTVFLNNIRNSIKEKGKLVFVQWDAEKMDSELPGWDSQDRELYLMHTMLKMIYDANYEVLEIKDFFAYAVDLHMPAFGCIRINVIARSEATRQSHIVLCVVITTHLPHIKLKNHLIKSP